MIDSIAPDTPIAAYIAQRMMYPMIDIQTYIYYGQGFDCKVAHMNKILINDNQLEVFKKSTPIPCRSKKITLRSKENRQTYNSEVLRHIINGLEQISHDGGHFIPITHNTQSLLLNAKHPTTITIKADNSNWSVMMSDKSRVKLSDIELVAVLENLIQSKRESIFKKHKPLVKIIIDNYENDYQYWHYDGENVFCPFNIMKLNSTKPIMELLDSAKPNGNQNMMFSEII